MIQSTGSGCSSVHKDCIAGSNLSHCLFCCTFDWAFVEVIGTETGLKNIFTQRNLQKFSRVHFVRMHDCGRDVQKCESHVRVSTELTFVAHLGSYTMSNEAEPLIGKSPRKVGLKKDARSWIYTPPDKAIGTFENMDENRRMH